jgi:hypothetical protein
MKNAAFNLRSLVRDVADNSDARDPGTVADEVFTRIPDENLAEALRETLRGYVRVVLAGNRMSPEPPIPASSPEIETGVAKPPTRSWKRDGIRDGWRRHLRDRIHVGPESASWKLLSECGFDDLMFAADERRQAAERTLARAENYEALAKAVKDHGAACVQDLPDDVLAAHLGEEAAQ